MLGFILFQGTRDLKTSLSWSDQIVNRVLSILLKDDSLTSEAYFKWYPFFNYWIRKLAHFLEYAVIGSLIATQIRRFKSLKLDILVYSLLGVVLVALLDEYFQRFSGRGSLVSDVWIDLWGGLSGIGVTLLLFKLKLIILHRF